MRADIFHIILILISALQLNAQNKPEFSGQLSMIGSYTPNDQLEFLTAARYIPEFSYGINVDTFKRFDFEASTNISGFVRFSNDSLYESGNIQPYRIWARYTSKQFELRIGLQKIDFGSATMLRPLQWFNQIDPRDPLQLTNGVYGALARYYFLNNANIWIWALYGNEKSRGLDIVNTYKKYPEAGARIQYPIPKGEIALSYHHRTADTRNLAFLPSIQKIPEDRIGLDAKWDIKIGLWFEASYIRKHRNIGAFTNQTLFNLGADYTIGIGNGLNVLAEHLLLSYDEKAFAFENTANISALSLSYPIGFFDNITALLYYNWLGNDFTFFINYSHQFRKVSAYVMAYYNPDTQQGIQENELVNNAVSGPGLRLLLVYNH